MSKHRISTTIHPYLLDDNDPYKYQNRYKSAKVLTTKTRRRILERTIKLYERTTNMAKNNKQKSGAWTKSVALVLISFTSTIGFGTILGGHLLDSIAGALIAFLLICHLLDYKI